MKIDISRLNLLEKDIEDWLYENPGDVMTFGGEIGFWMGRQYRLPSGIADLIGVTHQNLVAVIEIKNVPINKAAVLQVCRYAADLQEVLAQRDGYPHVLSNGEPVIAKVLIGPSIDDQTFNEARACGVSFMQFSLDFDLSLDSCRWSREHRERVGEQTREISHREEWARFGPHIDDLLGEMERDGFPAYDSGEWNPDESDRKDEYDALMDAVTGADEEGDPF